MYIHYIAPGSREEVWSPSLEPSEYIVMTAVKIGSSEVGLNNGDHSLSQIKWVFASGLGRGHQGKKVLSYQSN